MEPEQNQQVPQNIPPQTQTPPQLNEQQPQPELPQSPKKSHKKLALFLLIGPTALLLATLLLYALSNLITNSAQPAPSSEELFGNVSPLGTIINTLLFFFGVIGVLTWLPGIIIGAILLSKK